MGAISLLWTNDDITVGQTEQLRRQLDLLDRHGMPGVFFVIPKSGDRTIDGDPELLRLIESSRKKGHEYFQHGYIHTPFESGVPEVWMLDFAPDVRAQYDEERLELEKTHTLEVLTEMIENGRRIWRKAFGEDSVGYRPGWGAFCGNLYRALGLLGVQWSSSTLPCPTSWLYNQGKWDAPLNFRAKVPTRPHAKGTVLEFPLAGDYAFSVPDDAEKIERMIKLGLMELDVYHQRQDPMLIVSHWHGLQRNNDSGYRVHEALLPKLLASGKAEPMNMTKLVARYAA